VQVHAFKSGEAKMLFQVVQRKALHLHHHHHHHNNNNNNEFNTGSTKWLFASAVKTIYLTNILLDDHNNFHGFLLRTEAKQPEIETK